MSVLIRRPTGDTLHEMEQDTTLADTTEVDEHDDQIVDELLIEEISIDGMCGVY